MHINTKGYDFFEGKFYCTSYVKNRRKNSSDEESDESWGSNWAKNLTQEIENFLDDESSSDGKDDKKKQLRSFKTPGFDPLDIDNIIDEVGAEGDSKTKESLFEYVKSIREEIKDFDPIIPREKIKMTEDLGSKINPNKMTFPQNTENNEAILFVLMLYFYQKVKHFDKELEENKKQKYDETDFFDQVSSGQFAISLSESYIKELLRCLNWVEDFLNHKSDDKMQKYRAQWGVLLVNNYWNMIKTLHIELSEITEDKDLIDKLMATIDRIVAVVLDESIDETADLSTKQ
jgi:hypothetical protein